VPVNVNIPDGRHSSRYTLLTRGIPGRAGNWRPHTNR
jgi:hypothetical protein